MPPQQQNKIPPPVYAQQPVDDQDGRLPPQNKLYNQSEKFVAPNGQKERNGGQGQMGSYGQPNYGGVGGNQLLGNKKGGYNHNSWTN